MSDKLPVIQQNVSRQTCYNIGAFFAIVFFMLFLMISGLRWDDIGLGSAGQNIVPVRHFGDFMHSTGMGYFGAFAIVAGGKCLPLIVVGLSFLKDFNKHSEKLAALAILAVAFYIGLDIWGNLGLLIFLYLAFGWGFKYHDDRFQEKGLIEVMFLYPMLYAESYIRSLVSEK